MSNPNAVYGGFGTGVMEVWRLANSSMYNFATSISRWGDTLCIPL